jgi:hypothetical protein
MKTDFNKYNEPNNGTFMLKLTIEEKAKLKEVATKNNTTMQSLLRCLIQTDKTIESIYNEILIQD